MTDDLTTAVHRLTRETRTKVIQDGDGSGTNVAIVTHKPLLTQLNDAVTSAIGSGGGGGTATGSVLNDAAFGEVFKIRPAIESWCRAAGVTITRNMATDLAAWHEVYTGDRESKLKHVLAWEAKIKNLLDPPSRYELTDECPTCGAKEYLDEYGKVAGINPVIIEFRRDRPGEIRGLCRACEAIWPGEFGVRKLRWDMEQREEVG